MDNRKHYSSGRRSAPGRVYDVDGSLARQPEEYRYGGRHMSRPAPGRRPSGQYQRARRPQESGQYRQVRRPQESGRYRRARGAQESGERRTMNRPAGRSQGQPVQAAAERSRRLAERQRRVNQKIAMRNREKAFKLDLRYTLFLCVVVIITLGCCVMYLTAQSAVTQKNQEITALTSELSLLTDTNTTTRERINDAIDLEYVRDYAREHLGMVYPSASQIITYRSSEEDYVKQYQDIPQSGN